MKKEDVSSLFVYTVILALAIVFGIFVLKGRNNVEMQNTAYILFIIGAFVTGIVFNAILFELGHLAGAKIGRYNVVSLNILYFNFYLSEGKRKFRFKSFDGLTGETRIVPKENAKKPSNPTPYLTTGMFFYLLEVVAFVTLFALFGKSENSQLADMAYFVLIVAFVGGMIFLYQITPLKLDSTNDGHRLMLVSNPKNKIAFNELLRVENEIANGNKDVEIMTFDEITNFTADLNLNKIYLLLNEKKYDQAEPLIMKIIEAKDHVSSHVYLGAVSQLICIKMLTLPVDEALTQIEAFADEETKRDISKEGSMEASRAYILLAGLVDKSKSECIITINNIKRALKSTPKARQEIEVSLFNLALDKVIENHPDWELDQYRLQRKVTNAGTDKEKVDVSMKGEKAPVAEEANEEPKIETEEETKKEEK